MKNKKKNLSELVMGDLYVCKNEEEANKPVTCDDLMKYIREMVYDAYEEGKAVGYNKGYNEGYLRNSMED